MKFGCGLYQNVYRGRDIYLNYIRFLTRKFTSTNDNLINNLCVHYIDNHIIVVTKPAGILSQGDKTGDTSLLDIVKQYIAKKFNKQGDVYLGLVHRLDRPTSGVMVFARTSKAAARLSDAFKERLVEKKYICIVNGDVKGRSTLRHLMLKTNHEKTKVFDMNSSSTIKGNLVSAELSYSSILTFDHIVNKDKSIKQSILDISMVTGRKHQIRAQLSHMQFPIVGDLKYGASQSFQTRDICLHAYLLTIPHPITRKQVSFNSNYLLFYLS